ncbi:MAG: YkgJ family cysteine cluster protein [Bacteroidales bacterium]
MKIENHACRPSCAACCIAPSISSSIPGMENGKAAGVRCVNLNDDLLCEIFDSPHRPEVCKNFHFDPLVCGKSAQEAMDILSELENSN